MTTPGGDEVHHIWMENATGHMVQFVDFRTTDNGVAALAPPWYRTTQSWSGANRSTNLPLASSPHCKPITHAAGTPGYPLKIARTEPADPGSRQAQQCILPLNEAKVGEPKLDVLARYLKNSAASKYLAPIPRAKASSLSISPTMTKCSGANR